MMPKTVYYYESHGVSAGPVAATELIACGVRRETLVWTAGMSAWRAAEQVDGLASLFVTVPPPLPPRTGPPPLPTSVAPPSPTPIAATPAMVAVAPTVAFAPTAYSLPLVGAFKDDAEVWTMDSQQRFGTFAPNASLASLLEWGFQPLKSYHLELLDVLGAPLLTLHKPKAALLNPMRIGEVRVLDANQHLLGTCRHHGFKTLSRLLAIEDARGREILFLKRASFGSRDWVLETSTGTIGRVRRSQATDWTHLLFEHKRDRFELIFEPATRELHKALGIGAVVTAYLLLPS